VNVEPDRGIRHEGGEGSNDNYAHAGVHGETRGPAEIARQRAEHDAREAANIH
jgi:hypothetical protein